MKPVKKYKEPRYWIKTNLKKDGNPLWNGFHTMHEVNAYAKKKRAQGYNPTFDRGMERESCIIIAMEYLEAGNSFRNFENEQDIIGTDSPAIWSEAAKRLKDKNK